MKKGTKTLNRANFIILFLIVIIAIGAFIIFKQGSQIKDLRNSIPHLLPGEKIDYFDLTGTGNTKINSDILNNNKFSLICIFEQPCTPCNKNITMWKKIAGIFSGKVKVYGVILNGIDELADLSEGIGLNFDLYSSTDTNKFKEKFKVKPGLPQTILSRHNTVSYCKTGELEANDYFDIVNIIKGDAK